MPLRRFRRQYEQLSQFERGRIIGMMEAGWSARRVARQLGRSDCVVRRFWDHWVREISFTRKSGSGRPRQTSRREDRHILVDGIGCHCLQYTVNPSIDPWHLESPVVCPRHPAATFVATHARAPRSYFSTRQRSASHDKGVTALLLPFLGRSPDLSPIEYIWDHLGRRVGHPTSVNELEVRLQQI
ncbi:transposable element Tcb2 transposase [Trichonephila clavipes]|nr:transposable element Tcb2 transposase [Trichonephila clavipes]